MIIQQTVGDRNPTKESVYDWLMRQVQPLLRELRNFANRTEWLAFDVDLVDPINMDATIGDGTITARGRVIGTSMDVEFQIIWGTTSTYGTSGFLQVPLLDGYKVDTSGLVSTQTLVGETFWTGFVVESLLGVAITTESFTAQLLPDTVLITAPGSAPSMGDVVHVRVMAIPVKKA